MLKYFLHKKVTPPLGGVIRVSGDVLLSHTVSSAVPSALLGLTSLFEMGRGVSPAILSPGNNTNFQIYFKNGWTNDATTTDAATYNIEFKYLSKSNGQLVSLD